MLIPNQHKFQEFFTEDEISTTLLSSWYEYYDFKDRIFSYSIIYNSFNHSMQFLPTILNELDNKNSIATKYAFIKQHKTLISQDSIDFFHRLLHLDNPYITEEEGLYLSLPKLMNRDTLIKVMAVCSIGYAWYADYTTSRQKGIDSKRKRNDVAHRLNMKYKTSSVSEQDDILKEFKITAPHDLKSIKKILFIPALEELLQDNNYKSYIIKDLKALIFPQYKL